MIPSIENFVNMFLSTFSYLEIHLLKEQVITTSDSEEEEDFIPVTDYLSD